MKQDNVSLLKIKILQDIKVPEWLKRSTGDTLLSLGGVVLVAGMRGHYAAILCAVLSSLSFFGFFLGLESFAFDELEDFLDPGVFLATAVVTGQLTAGLRYHAEQAQRRER